MPTATSAIICLYMSLSLLFTLYDLPHDMISLSNINISSITNIVILYSFEQLDPLLELEPTLKKKTMMMIEWTESMSMNQTIKP